MIIIALCAGTLCMSSIDPRTWPLKLSICIATFNRSTFIGATLESILAQTTNDCEIVVLDGASTDDTEMVVSGYVERFSRLRYIKQQVNNGFDRDCDRAVELARGEYCWLMTDDDLLKPGAVAAVLECIRRNVGLVIVNVESRDFRMAKLLQHRWLDFEADRVYEPTEMDRLFVEVRNVLSYVGCFVIKKAIWLACERQRYYGSWFIHVGVVFQDRLPGGALVLAEPFISYRRGNTHTWSLRASEILFVKWPSLIGSLAVSESAKEQANGVEPWRNLKWLLLTRGWGCYSLTEYRRWVRPNLRSIRATFISTIIAVLPGTVVNALLVLYYTARQYRGSRLQFLKESRFYFRNWRIFKCES